MEQKNFSIINLNSKELKDIEQFCELNKIEDVQKFMHTCFKQGYEIKKFGLLNPGKTGGIEEKRVEIEVIREKRVEIPVEVIKEVLVQDTRVVDELLLERSVLKNKINELENKPIDNSKQKALEETIQKLRSELQLKNKEINDLKQIISEFKSSQDRQGIFLDGSNLNRTLNRK